ncbi:MAG: threonine/serine dehydratase [Anaerolineales bacterium]|nr:threonine/serine dehydratase [Anaerolineales bacterium]MCB9434014.1 threonine/serine dehydratase [Ardenticatenaceae bacterium]
MDEPTIAEIRETRALIDPYVASTPVWQWRGLEIEAELGTETEVFLKLELFQQTGTFKARGALRGMLALSPEKLAQGVTAVSAGNHAIAVSYAARILGTTAKVVMFKSANPARVAICRAYGAEVELMDNVHQAFARVREIEEQEGRTFIHPFEGKLTILGTATVGLELCEAVPNLDAVIVPIGGGGLGAGIATAVKLLQPNCAVYGVEPEGADSMSRSFASGQPEAIDAVRTIADSLGAPYALPYSFGLCQKYMDEIVLVDDDALRRAMLLLFKGMKLALEPAAAAATAALVGSLRQRLLGKRVGVIVCGTNTDAATFTQQITAVL